MTDAVVKGQWYRLPSGRIAEVRRLKNIPTDAVVAGTNQRQMRTEVVLRYLDNDGAMAAGEFQMAVAFLLKHGARVKVAPVVGVV